jgi:phenylalanyl-tRNA synthetase alpha chain
MGNFLGKIQQVGQEAAAAVQAAATPADVEHLRVKYLGRKGVLRDLLGEMGALPGPEKPAAGQAVNKLKNEITQRIEAAQKRVEAVAKPVAKAGPRLDVSLPGRVPRRGHRNLIKQTMDRFVDVFGRMGFEVASGPEVELVRYNFEALNIPMEHAARDAFDTFYFTDTVVLRSHTSPVQVREMERRKPPVRIIVPGAVYRPDTVDARHHFMFHHVEGLYVDEGVTMADLKYCMLLFAREFIRPDVKVRFRPDFFPFTEPSVELDISCAVCGGKGCSVCGQKGWVEVAGAGMVDPNVFKAVGYDFEKYTGFAFGFGVERMAMMKYGIDDIRLFTENDMRFLEQF